MKLECTHCTERVPHNLRMTRLATTNFETGGQVAVCKCLSCGQIFTVTSSDFLSSQAVQQLEALANSGFYYLACSLDGKLFAFREKPVFTSKMEWVSSASDEVFIDLTHFVNPIYFGITNGMMFNFSGVEHIWQQLPSLNRELNL